MSHFQPDAMCKRLSAVAAGDTSSSVPPPMSEVSALPPLLDRGWVMVDGVLGETWARSLLAECDKLHCAGLLARHAFEFEAEDGRRQRFEHAGRSTLDLEHERIHKEVSASAPLLKAFAATHAVSLANALARYLPELDLVLPATPQVKLQLTCGQHGCAPCHYDASESAPLRQITLLLYLSDDWHANNGGELQLIPFLKKPIEIAPRFDRGVLFLSDRVLHRSLPPKGEEGCGKSRWLLTVWLEGQHIDKVFGQRHDRLVPLLQRLVAPAVYADLYLAALDQSLPDGDAKRALQKVQLDEIRALEDDEDFADMINGLREVRDEVEIGFMIEPKQKIRRL